MRSSTFKIVLIYLSLSLAWIWGSEKLIELLSGKAGHFNTLEAIKGSAFVLVTAILLYLLIRGYYRKLKNSEREYRLLFEQNPCPMWFFDKQTLKFLAVNEAALKKYGYSREEFLQMSILDIRPEEEIVPLEEELSSLPPFYTSTGDWRHRLKDGRMIYVSIISQDVDFGGNIARWVMAEDVTEAKEKEMQVKEQNILLKEIARISSHEIRGPVASILGLLDLIERDKIGKGNNEEVLSMMGKAAGRLDEVIHRIAEKANSIYRSNA